VSGPSAASYLEPQQFQDAGIDLVYFDYAGYPPYRQLFPPFDHHVSVLDLILNEGPDARRYMLSF
jgi:WbqC-like protein family